ncbi:hypothetical protein ACSMXN_18455 [Jatrophihabitans sp. DSM 45814]
MSELSERLTEADYDALARTIRVVHKRIAEQEAQAAAEKDNGPNRRREPTRRPPRQKPRGTSKHASEDALPMVTPWAEAGNGEHS